tara:strand:+ start:302 stop:1051 length:750 start_codon:yes stop_codon:yes gene_type:complete
MGKETQFKDHLRNTANELKTNVAATWAASLKAPMLLHTAGEEVTRKNPFKEGEEMTYTPEPKFTFIGNDAFQVAASGAMLHGHMQLRDRASIYRTWCPPESDLCPALPNFTPGAKQMLSHFLQSYAAECATYARFVREATTKEDAPPSRISRKMMELGMEIADDKIFTAAGLARTQLFAGTEKAKKKKDGDAKDAEAVKEKKKAKKAKADGGDKARKEKDADGAKKTIKKAKPSKEKKAKPVSTGVEEE